MPNWIFTTKHVNTVEEYLKAMLDGYRVIEIPKEKHAELFEALKARRTESSAFATAYALALANGEGCECDFETAFYIFKALAEQGVIGAYRVLGDCYATVTGVPQSYETAVMLYQVAADQGDAEAQCCLGGCYALGRGFPQSYEKAVEWYQKAAEQGLATAQYLLATSYKNGCGVPQSDEKAAEWYQKAAEQGVASAQYLLGAYYGAGYGVPQSDEKAAEWYQKAAEQGHADAQNSLAACYSAGLGVPQSDEKAAEWYQKAAEQGIASAQYLLGVCYEGGQGIPQSYEKALMYFEKAAATVQNDDKKLKNKLVEKLQRYCKMGRVKLPSMWECALWSDDKVAQCELAEAYNKGEGVKRSLEIAMAWYRKAAENGNARACGVLGERYERGEGVPQSWEKAIEYYTKAAENGDESASLLLAGYYEKGYKVTKSAAKAYDIYAELYRQKGTNEAHDGLLRCKKEAVEYYRSLAEQGDVKAVTRLAEIYYSGYGAVPGEYECGIDKAIRLLEQAANANYAPAQTKLGDCYRRHGKGVKESYQKVFEWYRKAAANGDESAVEKMRSLEAHKCLSCGTYEPATQKKKLFGGWKTVCRACGKKLR